MSFRVYEGNILERIGLNRQMIGAGIAESSLGIANGISNSLQSSWNEDYTSFQHAGMGISEAFRGLTTVGVGLAFGIAAHSTLPRQGNWAFKIRGKEFLEKRHSWEAISLNGGEWATGEGGALKALNSRAAALDSVVTKEAIMKQGTKGFYTQASAELGPGGIFKKRPFVLSGAGFAATIAATVLIPWGVEKTLGLAGRLLDESHLAYNQAKYHTYDTRQFNNRSLQGWGMQAQESAMSTIVPFESNMLSIARLYHN